MNSRGLNSSSTDPKDYIQSLSHVSPPWLLWIWDWGKFKLDLLVKVQAHDLSPKMIWVPLFRFLLPKKQKAAEQGTGGWAQGNWMEHHSATCWLEASSESLRSYGPCCLPVLHALLLQTHCLRRRTKAFAKSVLMHTDICFFECSFD